jgi:hypothetical protein
MEYAYIAQNILYSKSLVVRSGLTRTCISWNTEHRFARRNDIPFRVLSGHKWRNNVFSAVHPALNLNLIAHWRNSSENVPILARISLVSIINNEASDQKKKGRRGYDHAAEHQSAFELSIDKVSTFQCLGAWC